jgi:hypothetical protein
MTRTFTVVSTDLSFSSSARILDSSVKSSSSRSAISSRINATSLGAVIFAFHRPLSDLNKLSVCGYDYGTHRNEDILPSRRRGQVIGRTRSSSWPQYIDPGHRDSIELGPKLGEINSFIAYDYCRARDERAVHSWYARSMKNKLVSLYVSTVVNFASRVASDPVLFQHIHLALTNIRMRLPVLLLPPSSAFTA